MADWKESGINGSDKNYLILFLKMTKYITYLLASLILIVGFVMFGCDKADKIATEHFAADKSLSDVQKRGKLIKNAIKNPIKASTIHSASAIGIFTRPDGIGRNFFLG